MRDLGISGLAQKTFSELGGWQVSWFGRGSTVLDFIYLFSIIQETVAVVEKAIKIEGRGIRGEPLTCITWTLHGWR